MYSVVLLMTMTGAGDVPAGMCHSDGGSQDGRMGHHHNRDGRDGRRKHHHHRRDGRDGNNDGWNWSSCCGGCSGGCYGWSCGGGCYGGNGGGYGCDGGAIAPVAPVAPMPPAEPIKEPVKKGDKGDKGAMAPAPATIIVTLPADARLTIDDEATASSTERRVFVSPELAPGREFSYTLKAEWVRDGKTIVISKRITVSAGNESKVTLEAEQPADVASR